MANKKLNAVITIGGAVASSLLGSLANTKGKLLEVGGALKSLEGRQKLLSQAIKTFGAMGKNVDGLRSKYAAITAQVDKLRTAHERLRKVEAAQQANSQKRADYRGQIFDTVALGAAAIAPIKIAADRESHALGIAKQMDGARDSAGNLTQAFWDMRKQVVAMGHEIPLATNDLFDLATAGLRMGVSAGEIGEFTKNTAKLASALELPAEEVGDQFGKIRNLYKLSMDELRRLGDAVNYLDDQNTVKGGELIDFLQRVGGSAGMAKVTATEMAGIGTALISMGESAETASTSVRALFTKISAGDSGTKKARAAIESLGLVPQQLAKGMTTDAVGTIQKVMAAINSLPADKRTGTITDIFGLEHVGQISKLATSTKEVNEAISQARESFAEGTSVQKEFSNTVNSTNAQTLIMRNRIEDIGDSIGTVLLPSVNQVLGVIGKGATVISNFAQEHPMLTKVVVGAATSMIALRVSTLAAGYAFTFIKGGALQVIGMMAKLRAGAVLASGAMPFVVGGIRAIGMAFVSTGIGALVAGLALGGYMIYKNWDGIKAFLVGTFEGVKAGLQPLVTTFGNFANSLSPLKPMFDMIGGALKSAWQWFTDLIGPVVFTQEELGKAGASGKSFGEALAAGINFVLTPLNLLITGLTWVANNIGGVMDKAVAFKNTVGDGIGGAWQGAKEFFGAGGDKSPAVGEALSTNQKPLVQSGAFARSMEPEVPGLPGNIRLPTIPPMAGASGGGSYEDKSTTTIQITQQPGEDSKVLARRVAEEQERQRKIRQRGAMHDGTVTQ